MQRMLTWFQTELQSSGALQSGQCHNSCQVLFLQVLKLQCWVKQSWPIVPLCWLAHMPAEKCHGTEAGDSSFHSFSSSFRGTDSSFLALHQEGIPVFEGQILVTVYSWVCWEFFFYKCMKHLHNCELDSMYSSSSNTVKTDVEIFALGFLLQFYALHVIFPESRMTFH